MKAKDKEKKNVFFKIEFLISDFIRIKCPIFWAVNYSQCSFCGVDHWWRVLRISFQSYSIRSFHYYLMKYNYHPIKKIDIQKGRRKKVKGKDMQQIGSNSFATLNFDIELIIWFLNFLGWNKKKSFDFAVLISVCIFWDLGLCLI